MIEIKDQPINYNPAYAQCTYVVLNSADNAENNFKYIAEVYDSQSVLLGELKSGTNPDHGWGKFDISSIVSNNLKEQIDFDELIYAASDGIEDIQVQFGWEYVSGSGEFVRFENDESDTKTYFNGSPFFNEYTKIRELSASNEHPFVITAGASHAKYPLTSRRTIETSTGTKQWLYYMRSAEANIRHIDVRDDSTNNIERIDIPVGLQDNTIKMIAVRVDSESIEPQTTFTDLTQWSIRTSDATNGATSEWISYSLLPCSKWEKYSLYYLNRWGGFDSIPFNGKSTSAVSTQRETYKVDYTPIGSNGVVDYSGQHHSQKDYWVESTTRIILWTDWISYTSKVSAIDLQSSPLVWLEDEDGVILPVTISQDSFEIENKYTNDLISLKMEVRYQQPIKRQRV